MPVKNKRRSRRRRRRRKREEEKRKRRRRRKRKKGKKKKKKKNPTLSFHFFLTRNGGKDDLAVTFEIATGRHLACSSVAVTGTQIHNTVLLARVSPWMLIGSCLKQQLTTLLAVVCVYCCANTKATDRGIVYIAPPHRPSSATQRTSLYRLPRCNSSVTVVTSIQVARAGKSGFDFR
jgi:hypothetical protein